MSKKEKWTPRKYQKKAVKWLVSKPEAALFLDPGLGKTSATLAAFMALRKAGKVNKMLVIAPLRVCYMVWTQDEGGELAKWSNFSKLKVVLLHGTKKEKALEEDADIYVTNFDSIEWLSKEKRLTKLVRRGVDVLTIDELSAFKRPNTKRFKILKPYLSKFTKRWGLTGTPASNGLMDLFGQLYVLDLGAHLGKYITHYRRQYFYPSGFGGYTWELQDDGEKRIYKKISDIALSMRAVDHLDLPEFVEQDLWVALSKKAATMYSTFEEELIAMIEDNLVTASNAGVAAGKCRQIAGGGVYQETDNGDREVFHVHDEKTKALMELIDELQGSPLLIAYEFEHDLARIRKALGKDTPAIGGGVSPKKAGELVRRWNKGELKVLCGHPAAMSHGLNMQGSGHHICWYTPTWNLEHYDQLNRRVWRQGSKAKRVTVHRILARSTIDEVIVNMLNRKRAGQNALFQALKKMPHKK